MKKNLPLLLRILSIGLQLTYVKSYTHYLSVTELGYSFYLTALSYAINALVLIPADFYQQALLSAYYDRVFPLGSIISLNKKILSLAMALTTVLSIPICVAGKLNIFDVVLIFGLAVFLYFSTSFRNYLNNRGHNLFTGWMLFLEAGLKILSFMLLLAAGVPHVNAFVLSTVIAFAVEVLCLAIFFYLKIPFTQCYTADISFKSLFKTSSAVSFSAVCNWLQLQGYRIVYVWLGFPEIAGIYAAVSNLGIMGMNAASIVFSQMFLPKVYSSRGAYIIQYIKYAVLLCLVVLLGYIMLGKILLLVLTKREFEPYARLMIFGVIVEAGNLLIGAASTYFTIRRKSFHLVLPNIAGVLCAGIGLSICLSWRPRNFYLLGLALMCSQLIVCALLFERAKKDMKCEVVGA